MGMQDTLIIPSTCSTGLCYRLGTGPPLIMGMQDPLTLPSTCATGLCYRLGTGTPLIMGMHDPLTIPSTCATGLCYRRATNLEVNGRTKQSTSPSGFSLVLIRMGTLGILRITPLPIQYCLDA
ncbi:hypothetical protein CHS0354_009963 [Potamilus streckersoni]|uniref:Uncharacterized protein n=1 Tax=Potamilus streckersoni TaxID=2493646 RepID=A0AAE0TDR2_9BIVA|nr:hypothetical protein CHS0354_009963 [Potamilus streckersoni]